MTAEERQFYLEWFVEMKRKENESREGAGTAPTQPKFGPSV